MTQRPITLFADKLPPQIGGMEEHGGAFIHYFHEHPRFPLKRVVRSADELFHTDDKNPILFFNSGMWIEKMLEIRKDHPSAIIIYRTGGNEIIKAPLDREEMSHQKRQAIWVEILNRSVDLIITNSAFTEKRLADLGLHIPFKRCVGGVHIPTTAQPAPAYSPKKRFFCAARFVPYKNHTTLIHAFNALSEEGIPCDLFLSGSGPLLEKMKTLAKPNKNIHFLGACDNQTVMEQIAQADVYIQLSCDYEMRVPGGTYMHSEGMGRSYLEAISLGTYVIGGKSGALEEIITPDRGTVVNPTHLDAILKELKRAIDTPTVRAAPTSIYSWETLFKTYEQCYENLNRH